MFTDNPVLNALTEKGIDYTVTKEGIKIDGFYKSGEILLTPNHNRLGLFVAHSRYNRDDYISSFDDLVYLNYDWWINSRNRFDGWKDPNPLWNEEFKRLGLI